jgi:hydroxyacylglutathione hydrolase
VEIKQYYLGCLSHASYLISDQKSKTAVVVDPQRDVDQYVRDAEKMGVKISDVVLTHFHADFVAGHLELQEKTGAQIHLGSKAKPEYAFKPTEEGDVLSFGDTRLEFLETPGHTPEGLSVVAYDLAKDPNKPIAVLTGDTLFAGDVGRPDLAVSTGHAPDALASQLYDSLHQKLLKLPDDTVVYPAHGPGSSCGSAGLKDTESTIGAEKQSNPMLQHKDRESFVQALTKELPAAPAYFAHSAEMNQIERPTLDEQLVEQVKPLKLSVLEELKAQGGTVLDVRSPDDYSARHYRGSLQVGLDGRFAEWAGSLADLTRPIAVIAPPGRETEAVIRLNRVGFEQVVGFLDGGTAALSERPDLQATQPRILSADLAKALQSDSPPYVLDVRTKGEFAKGHLEGAVNIPLNELPNRRDELPSDRQVVVHCQSGYRSAIAASVIGPSEQLLELKGGYADWVKSGHPVVR